jgi:hypothetical protein
MIQVLNWPGTVEIVDNRDYIFVQKGYELDKLIEELTKIRDKK